MKADWVFHLRGDTRGIVRQLAPGMLARIFVGQHVMISVVRIEPHSQGQSHSHPEEQWGVLLEGRCTRIQGDEEVDVTVGDFWHTPGGVRHSIRTSEARAVVLDVFSPPRPEYKRPGEGFGGPVEGDAGG